MYFSLFFLISCAQVIHSNKFAFGVFENAKGLKDIYKAEKTLYKSLRVAREILVARRDFVLNQNASSHLSPDIKNVFDESAFQGFDSLSFAKAKRGFMVLLDTYKFDLKSLLQGEVRDENKSFKLQSQERLKSKDLLELSEEAFDFKWYDTSIALLRAYLKNNSDPSTDSFRDKLVQIHNAYLKKHLDRAGENYKVFPYLIDSVTLKKRKKQPKIITKTDFYDRKATHLPSPPKLHVTNLKESYKKHILASEFLEEEYRRICREDMSTIKRKPHKCILLHHNDPYLRLGPFQLEIVTYDPPRMILVDFFTEKEMQYMKNESYPYLSKQRKKNISLKEARKVKKVRIVHKSVQHWLKDIEFNSPIEISILRDAENKFDSRFPDWFEETVPKDVYGFKVVSPILYSLSHKIEHATRLKIRGRWGSTNYQVTNYGLGGLCELHLDPHGIMKGYHIPDDRADLYRKGDMILTLMGWLDDVDAGGATAFVYPGREGLIKPKKGSAAIWFNLHRNGLNNQATMHGGCPVAGGTKWILNKWTFYFDQMNNYPCGLNEFDEFQVFDNKPQS